MKTWHHGLTEAHCSYKAHHARGTDSALGASSNTPSAPKRPVVEDNPAEQMSIRELLSHDDIDVSIAASGAEALSAVTEQAFDCVVLDLRLPDMTGFDVLERLSDTPALNDLPVAVFTGKELSPEEDARLHTLARDDVVKG
jgi:CheY-like chemotaxis protein